MGPWLTDEQGIPPIRNPEEEHMREQRSVTQKRATAGKAETCRLDRRAREVFRTHMRWVQSMRKRGQQ